MIINISKLALNQVNLSHLWVKIKKASCMMDTIRF